MDEDNPIACVEVLPRSIAAHSLVLQTGLVEKVDRENSVDNSEVPKVRREKSLRSTS
jgi:hypothetical protein